MNTNFISVDNLDRDKDYIHMLCTLIRLDVSRLDKVQICEAQMMTRVYYSLAGQTLLPLPPLGEKRGSGDTRGTFRFWRNAINEEST